MHNFSSNTNGCAHMRERKETWNRDCLNVSVINISPRNSEKKTWSNKNSDNSSSLCSQIWRVSAFGQRDFFQDQQTVDFSCTKFRFQAVEAAFFSFVLFILIQCTFGFWFVFQFLFSWLMLFLLLLAFENVKFRAWQRFGHCLGSLKLVFRLLFGLLNVSQSVVKSSQNALSSFVFTRMLRRCHGLWHYCANGWNSQKYFTEWNLAEAR